MKKILTLLLAFTLLFGFASCANNGIGSEVDLSDSQQTPGASVSNEPTEIPTASLAEPPSNTPSLSEDSEILIAYFSWSGNTEKVADMIYEQVGGDLFEIVPANPYPTDYNECLEQARQELNDDYRPALDTHIENTDSYDIVFIGYPIWCGDTPMPIRSFLEEYDFNGKIVIPFCTYGGSGVGESLAVISTICSDSTILDVFGIAGSDVENSQNGIQEWLDGVGIDTYLDTGIKSENGENAEAAEIPKLKVTVDDTELTATLLDNPTSRDLLTMLPLTLTFNDYNSTEKISYPPRSLSTEDAPTGYEPSAGDITVYAPWGNIAIFYKDFRYGDGLIPLGSFDSGIEMLAEINDDFTMTIEVME